jgi:hypothetical protein
MAASHPTGWLEPRRRVDKALYAVVMEANTGGISTRNVDNLVEALEAYSGISKTEFSKISQGLDEQVKAFLGRPLDHAYFPYVYLDATYRLGRNLPMVSWAGWWRSASMLSATARCSASPWAIARLKAFGVSPWAHSLP